MTTPRVRREPPRFRIVTLVRKEPITPRLVRCTFGGDDLAGFPKPDPAASVRVLFPAPGTTELVMPEWNGNEYLLPGSGGGTRLRPYIRTFTPRATRTEATDTHELDVDVVLHGNGVASSWVEAVELGVPTGNQDYLAALHGGLTAWHHEADGTRRERLPLPPALGRRLVLAYTGQPRHSGFSNWEMFRRSIEKEATTLQRMGEIARIARAMRDALLASDLDEAGRLLGEEGRLRYRLAPSVGTPLLLAADRAAR